MLVVSDFQDQRKPLLDTNVMQGPVLLEMKPPVETGLWDLLKCIIVICNVILQWQPWQRLKSETWNTWNGCCNGVNISIDVDSFSCRNLQDLMSFKPPSGKPNIPGNQVPMGSRWI